MNPPSERRFPRLPFAKSRPHGKKRSREEEAKESKGRMGMTDSASLDRPSAGRQRLVSTWPLTPRRDSSERGDLFCPQSQEPYGGEGGI